MNPLLRAPTLHAAIPTVIPGLHLQPARKANGLYLQPAKENERAVLASCSSTLQTGSSRPCPNPTRVPSHFSGRRRRGTSGPRIPSTKNKPRIKFHAMLLQQRAKLVGKTHLPVMGILILYIAHYRWNVRRAHTERSIPLLPFDPVRPGLQGFILTNPELQNVSPPRRIGFDRCDGLRQRQTRRNLHQQMNVVFHASNGVYNNPMLLANSGRIGPQLGPKFCGNALAPLLGAEHHMNHILRIGMGNVPRPPARLYLYIKYPAFTRWADLCHAYRVLDHFKATK